MKPISIFFIASLFILISCGPTKGLAKKTKRISNSAKENVLNDPALQTAHVGISIYEPATGKYWFNYQGDKYFVPASNTKLATCYAAMKYLGDSLVAGRYLENKGDLIFQPNGDPSFLLAEFTFQPLPTLFKDYNTIVINDDNWQDDRWGSGWSWNDYEADYMAERSAMPVYGNVVTLIPSRDTTLNYYGVDIKRALTTIPSYFINNKNFINQGMGELKLTTRNIYFRIGREISSNEFQIFPSLRRPGRDVMSFYTGSFADTKAILKDTLHQPVEHINIYDFDRKLFSKNKARVIRSQPTDSLLKPMMHRSDNFFAEQSLLMVSNEVLGVMNDSKVIDTILKTDFKDLPQKPRWVDGSGLSRYNLFTPQDLVSILNKMKNEFGMERVKNILATGNTGTLSNYYVAENGYIFAKTGTLSGVVALSGFLYTKNKHLLIFSVQVNNHNSSASSVRRAVEKFIEGIRNNY